MMMIFQRMKSDWVSTSQQLWLNQLSQSADDLKGGLSESERVAAIKAARKLAQSLEKPRDAILKMSYSVFALIYSVYS
ncbi:S-adenosyl-L-methionine-dependent methyltransferase [Penicillium malachiteum]|uniref:S-adenosyl-L-methionine-dependent methyltransferase n=1 Tax=Penicillium malachiteum TaxID=1324776 RepID=UPI0025483D5C|nr:S-adenosyl-L-methionine-dependent methyltransferase [Penicillium malachiteum]KAJ5735868.1 S-adenosyl-L-methionine-dependent methyltransferase [Penicillium malachiteum]